MTKNAVKKTILRQWEDDSQFAEFFESFTINVGKVCQSQRAFGGTLTTLDKHWKWLEEFDALSLFGKIVVAGVKDRLLEKLERADMWHTLQSRQSVDTVESFIGDQMCTELTKLGKAMHKRRNDTANWEHPKLIASAFHKEDEWIMGELKQLLEAGGMEECAGKANKHFGADGIGIFRDEAKRLRKKLGIGREWKEKVKKYLQTLKGKLLKHNAKDRTKSKVYTENRC
uniref:Reverse transcriptase domain-containing protein n=1 Tax=Globodera pallida TaxID=36090 RepID=A0A183BM12_GLOPA